MTHGDDDGLRVPPALAPFQVVILPMLRDKPEDEALLAYCEELRAGIAKQSAMDEAVRVLLDKRPGKAAAKRWDWVRKGAPVIIEVGGRDMENGVVSLLERNALWNTENGKPAFAAPAKDALPGEIGEMLEAIQRELFEEARARREANIRRDISDMDALAEHFSREAKYPGWVEVQWAKPTGDALAKVVETLKDLRLTLRNVPMDAEPANGPCIFTGEPAVERVYVARAY